MCVCERERDWVTLLYNRKLTEHCKSTVMEKIKIFKKKNTQRKSEKIILINLGENYGRDIRRWAGQGAF